MLFYEYYQAFGEDNLAFHSYEVIDCAHSLVT